MNIEYESDQANSFRMSNVLITFDIDGTLLVSKGRGHHYAAFRHALNTVFQSDDVVQQPPGTDLGISRGIISQALHCENIDTHKMQEFIQATEDYYVANYDGQMDIMPGVQKALEVLSAMPNVSIGLCTGNFEKIGWAKVEAAGLSEYFKDRIAGFGNNHEDRTDILKEAISNAKMKKGCNFDKIIHIGDSPADVRAANDTNNISILVKTSPFTFDSFPTPSYTFENLDTNLHDLIAVVEGRQP